MCIREIFWVHTVSDASYFSWNLGLHTLNTGVSLGSTEEKGGNWGFRCKVRIRDIVSIIILIVIVSSSLARKFITVDNVPEDNDWKWKSHKCSWDVYDDKTITNIHEMVDIEFCPHENHHQKAVGIWQVILWHHQQQAQIQV